MAKCIADVGKLLNNEKSPLKDRFRALFTLKNLGGHEAIDIIAKSFNDPSALLKHELAYCLGQMQDSYAIRILTKVLMDRTQEPMVRHEAGKTLIFYGLVGCYPNICKYSQSPPVQVKDPYTGSILMHVGSSCKHTGVYNVHLSKIIGN